MNRLTEAPLNVEELRQAIESVRGEAEVSGIDYRVTLPEKIHCQVNAETMHRLALHLINRSINRILLHPPRQGATISVAAEEFGGEFHFSVRDNCLVIDRLFASDLSQTQFGEWYYEFDPEKGNYVAMSLPLAADPRLGPEVKLSLAR